jgi:ADP-ribose pyrophosphatase YjhB (NUDIX family)
MNIIVVGGIIEKDGKYLLVKENRGRWKGTWNIPAGCLEDQESIIEGACREVFEETWCSAEAVGIVDILNRIYDDMNIVSFLFDMKLKDENISFDDKEIAEAKWFTYDEITCMKDQLRADGYFINSIKKKDNNEILPLDIVTMNRYFVSNK